MKRPDSPCKINGVDCTERKLGCRTDCEGWQRYEADMAEYRAKVAVIHKQKQVIGDYRLAGMTKRLHLEKQQRRK